jgi:hypothetical protein
LRAVLPPRARQAVLVLRLELMGWGLEVEQSVQMLLPAPVVRLLYSVLLWAQKAWAQEAELWVLMSLLQRAVLPDPSCSIPYNGA